VKAVRESGSGIQKLFCHCKDEGHKREFQPRRRKKIFGTRAMASAFEKEDLQRPEKKGREDGKTTKSFLNGGRGWKCKR